jgi:hypothetical protein
MKYSKDTIENLKAKIRLIAVRGDMPITCRSVAKRFNIDRNFAGRLIREIEREQIERISKTTINEELSELQQVHSAVKKELWEIVNGERTTCRNKLAAIRQIMDSDIEYTSLLLKYKFGIDYKKEVRKLYKNSL